MPRTALVMNILYSLSIGVGRKSGVFGGNKTPLDLTLLVVARICLSFAFFFLCSFLRLNKSIYVFFSHTIYLWNN